MSLLIYKYCLMKIEQIITLCNDNGIFIYPVHLPIIKKYKKNGKWFTSASHRDKYTIEINRKGNIKRDSKQDYKANELSDQIKKYYKFFVKRK